MYERIVVPDTVTVRWAIVPAPTETPFGVMEGAAIDCEFGGKTYRILEFPAAAAAIIGGPVELQAMDLETGDIVTLSLAKRWPYGEAE